jgi:hypothetical protein
LIISASNQTNFATEVGMSACVDADRNRVIDCYQIPVNPWCEASNGGTLVPMDRETLHPAGLSDDAEMANLRRTRRARERGIF